MSGHDPAATARPSHRRPMALLLVTSFGALASFYVLVPVVPLYAVAGGAGDLGAGLPNGTMLLATVLTEFAVPGLLRRFGYRAATALGVTLLGVPCALMAASSALPVLLAACLARGAGLGIVVVAGPALIAQLVPEGRRGGALGVYGAAVGIPAVLGLPLGLWLSLHLGYGPVFAAGAALALATVVTAAGLPGRQAGAEAAEPPAAGPRAAGLLGGLRDPGLARPAAVFAAITLAAGIVLTFLPLAMPPAARQTAAAALLCHAAAMPVARWLAGRHSDRHGSSGLLVPAVLASAAGMALMARLDSPYVVIAGATLFGLGFGAAQNLTLELMFARSARAEFGRVSALWNLAYDGGMGLGAAGFGLVAGQVGYSWGFALTAAAVLTALGPAWLDRRARPPGDRPAAPAG